MLKKNAPKNFILSNSDAIKLIEYKLLRQQKLFIIGMKCPENVLDKILTKEDPSKEVYSTYDRAIRIKNEKIEKINTKIKELQDYVSLIKQIGGDLIG